MHGVRKKKEAVVLVYWKVQNETEVFSSLLNFCQCYPRYHYTVLCNCLIKGKGIYESGAVRVERKSDFVEAVADTALSTDLQSDNIRNIQGKEALEDISDWKYWLSQSGDRRAEAVTFLVLEKLKRGLRVDKAIVNSIKVNY